MRVCPRCAVRGSFVEGELFGVSDDRCDVQSEIHMCSGKGVRCYGTARGLVTLGFSNPGLGWWW